MGESEVGEGVHSVLHTGQRRWEGVCYTEMDERGKDRLWYMCVIQ